jgi:hypothetical protein
MGKKPIIYTGKESVPPPKRGAPITVRKDEVEGKQGKEMQHLIDTFAYPQITKYDADGIFIFDKSIQLLSSHFQTNPG